MVFPFAFFLLPFLGCATAPYQPPSIVGIPKPIGGIYHEVHQGDTLWRIAQVYGMDVTDIVKANNIPNSAKINAGQRLFIPGAKTPHTVTAEKTALYEKDLFIWPLSGDCVSYFSQETYGARNKGIDIKAKEGGDVVASKGGKVVFCSNKVKGLGRVIIIDHLDGFSTVYARNSQNLVKVGDRVEQNQVIAKAGSTGRGATQYLHFEIRRRHKSQNPLYYLP